MDPENVEEGDGGNDNDTTIDEVDGDQSNR